MEEIMRAVFGFLSAGVGIYSLLIFIRIIFSWFRGITHESSGKVIEILNKITDPYLNWWRNNLKLQVGFLDFSTIAAIVSLSFIQNILFTLSVSERMTLGFILAQILLSIWTIISFIIGFFMIIIFLRFIAYVTNRNIYSLFWGAIDSISAPVLYRINRIIYGNKIGNYLNGLIFSFIILGLLLVAGKFIIDIIAGFLINLPI